MAKKPMYLFTKEDMDNLLKSLDIEKREVNGEEVLINPKTEATAQCECCDSKMTADNLGSISHSTMKFYCKDPVCFSQLVASKRIW